MANEEENESYFTEYCSFIITKLCAIYNYIQYINNVYFSCIIIMYNKIIYGI